MAIRKYKKPTAKDLAYNIALLKQDIMVLNQTISVLDSVVSNYVEMKKDTDKFNKFLQNKIEKKAKEAKENEW